ncbi:protein BatD [Vibrio anguillarum]|uniref:Protein BatD n=1 Tax=Vibrio anguillarum TaxID=55601 RepID=A0A289GHY0_VIBAN|nr:MULTISPECIES: BatD family protein [Vibrio]ASW83109.1 aerotolerance protein BatD [Vibrio anguillarum]AXN05446.1 protein BatD [Vibrio anguillarum]AZS27296.1 protein BatD [Vibrio anguillarum]MBF4310064.1 protein BatD [Vibrio anguillarum]MBF4326342.1 protein BatD [Vibrio anguillarum]
MVSMKSIKRSFWAAIISLVSVALLSSAANAAALYASVSKNKVAKNEVFQLRIVADEKVSTDAIDFKVLEGDFFLGRPSFGTSVNIINGDRSTRSEWNVSLAANKLGILTIPSFTVNGATTQPIAIQVIADGESPKQSDLVEIQADLERSKLYPSESTFLNARLIIKADPRRLQNPQITPPAVQGLELTTEGEANQYQSLLDGVEVTVVDQKFRVTAQEAGTFTLSGPAFKAGLIYGNNQTGSTRLLQVDIPAKTFSLTVLPKPDIYQGTWLPTPKLTLNQTWRDATGQIITAESFKTKVGESLTREWILTVKGLTQTQLPNLSVQYPDSIRLYAEKPQFKSLDNGDVQMTLKQVLIPKTVGKVDLADLTVSWWDTKNESQQSAQAKGLTLEVSPGELLNPSTSVLTPPTVQTVTVKDAGYWPYFTAFFALLWMATMVVAWSFRNAPQTATQETDAHHQPLEGHPYQQLKEAVQSRDGAKISYYFTLWRDSVVLSDEEKTALDAQVNQQLKTLYAPQKSDWDGSALISMIDAIQKKQTKRQHKKLESLAKL